MNSNKFGLYFIRIQKNCLKLNFSKILENNVQDQDLQVPDLLKISNVSYIVSNYGSQCCNLTQSLLCRKQKWNS